MVSLPLTNSSTPTGLRIHTKGQALERVLINGADIALLVTGQGTEIIKTRLAKNQRITLEPLDDPISVTETYYILQGKVACQTDSGTMILGSQDYLVTEQLGSPVILSALTNVTFLYITTQPFFHNISQFQQEFMSLAVEVECKDGYTSEHCLRLQELSYATGQELALEPFRLHRLNYGSYLHDLGKVRVPIEILQKPAKLAPEEWEVIKQHPTYGREMLSGTPLNDIGCIVEQHHERLDGSGYPYALSGENILVESYIVAVADTYDAMTTDRPYRKALSPEVAFAELEKYAGIHYPLEVVKAFSSAVKRVELSGL
jgi:HD-GYP domain-containing protein (c-di-GMP phosphodiesterase class II)